MNKGHYVRFGGESQPIHVWVEFSARNSFEDAARLFLAMDDLYKSIGGDGLTLFHHESYVVHSAPLSELDLLMGTPFEERRKVVESSVFTPSVSRREVYKFILKHAIKGESRDRLVKDLRDELIQRYPVSIWENQFPYFEVIDFLLRRNGKSISLRATENR